MKQDNHRIRGTDAVLQMAQLNMAEDVIPISAKSPAALNRYIYYPDHLVRMPGPLPGVGLLTNLARNFMNVLKEPIFKGTIPGILAESTVDIRPSYIPDESVGEFVSRRFGRPVADNLVSALLHGIYAGNLYELSARTILPLFWHLEEISEAGIVGELVEQIWNGETLLPYDDVRFNLQSDQTIDIPSEPVKALATKLEGSSVYTFKKGLAQLAQKTEAGLRESKNVEVKHMAAAIAYDSETKQFRITDAHRQTQTPEENTSQYDYVVSTLSPPSLCAALLGQDTTIPVGSLSPTRRMSFRVMASSFSVNVMVVNLFYRDPNLVPVPGFGYLLPRSLPIDQNPERALGVIFGSETSRSSFVFPTNPEQTINLSQDSAPGTKLTVMLGGHWWSSWHVLDDLPNEESGIEMAKSVLQRHLGITDQPIVAKARMQYNSIPQYLVGHHQRMAELHRDVRLHFDGRLKLAGSAYSGVGVNDCVKAARKVCFDIREGLDERTGLEGFDRKGGSRWAVYKKRERTVDMLDRNKKGKGGEDGEDG